MAGSSTQSAWFVITLVTIIYRSTGELIVCNQPDNFTVQITENEHVVYGIDLSIKYYNPHIEIVSYPGAESINATFNESIIEFKGYMSPEYQLTQPDLSPERLSWSASGIILGIGTLQKLSSEDYALRECRLFLPKNIEASANLPKVVEDEIINYAQSCAKEQLCQEIETLKAEEFQNIKINNENEYKVSRAIRSDNPKLNINVPVDAILNKIINYIKLNDEFIIKLPDISETHIFGILLKWYFKAANGNFENVWSLKRTEDATMYNIEKKYVLQGGFGLPTAKFYYDYYKLTVGSISIKGQVLGTINGLAAEGRLIINYSENCSLYLEYVKVVEFGDINLKLSGLGLFNSLTSKVLTGLTRIWRDKIIKVIEVNMKNTIERELKAHLCKNYTQEMAVLNNFAYYNYENIYNELNLI